MHDNPCEFHALVFRLLQILIEIFGLPGDDRRLA